MNKAELVAAMAERTELSRGRRGGIEGFYGPRCRGVEEG